MNQRHQHRTAFELRDNRRLTFYPVVFDAVTTIYQRDGSSFREKIAPTAFSADLADPSHEVVAVVDHKQDRELARRSNGSLYLTEDPHGVFATLWAPETPLGDAVLQGVKDGSIWGCSFGFEEAQTRSTADGVIEVTKASIFDVTLVMNGEPAYKQTEVHLRSRAYIDSLLARYRYQKFITNTLNKIS